MKKREEFNMALKRTTARILGLSIEEYDSLIRKHKDGVHSNTLKNVYWEIYNKKAN